VKESDRLQAVYNGLKLCGVEAIVGDDWLKITGGKVSGGADVQTNMDHRIAMSFLILGMVSKDAIKVDDITMINTSFPDFVNLMNSIGAKISI
jgi:3-phosphoshikimate 1-carboxyvinyltransferase